MKKRIFQFIAIFLPFLSFGQNIDFTLPGKYPEGIAYWEKHQKFVVASIVTGEIGLVDTAGKYEKLFNHSNIISPLGMKINSQKDLLYVAIADFGVSDKSAPKTIGKHAQLLIYDLKNNKQKQLIDLAKLTHSKTNLANDVAFDSKHNIYITDTSAPYIYKVTAKGEASVFCTYPEWAKEGFNLNGIVVSGQYLIACQTNTGKLFRISIKNPKDIQVINTINMAGCDGLALNPNNPNELCVVSFTENTIYKISTQDHWVSAKSDATYKSIANNPTTAVWVKDQVYIINSEMNDLFQKDHPKNRTNYKIQAIKLSN